MSVYFIKGIHIAKTDVKCKVKHPIFHKSQRFLSNEITFLGLKIDFDHFNALKDVSKIV